jgi:hypothetical protein
MAGLKGSSLDGLGGSFFRGSGQADDSALRTVRRPTPYLRASARPDIPARASRRIAAYSSTFDDGMTTLLDYEAHPSSHRKPSGEVRTHKQRLQPDRTEVTPDEQLRSVLANKTTRQARYT